MNWDAIGALAELVGAVAVLFTLAYLAIQIRQNAQSINRQSQIAQAQTLQTRADSVVQLSSMITTEPKNLELLTKLRNTKGISPADLTPDENTRASLILTALRANLENTFMQYEQGYLPEEFYLDVGKKNNLTIARLLIDFELPLTESFRAELIKNLSEEEHQNDT